MPVQEPTARSLRAVASCCACPTAYVGEEYEIEMESEEGSGCTSEGTHTSGTRSSTAPFRQDSRCREPALSQVLPRALESRRFWVWNHDLTLARAGPIWCVREDRSEVEFTISVDPGLEIDNESLKGATVGQPLLGNAHRHASREP